MFYLICFRKMFLVLVFLQFVLCWVLNERTKQSEYMHGGIGMNTFAHKRWDLVGMCPSEAL